MSAAKANRVPEFFIEEPVIRLSDLRRRITDKSELKTAVIALRTRSQSVRVQTRNRDLVLDREAGRAELNFTARVRVVSDSGTEAGEDEVRSTWVKERDGKWRIESLEMDSEFRGGGGF